MEDPWGNEGFLGGWSSPEALIRQINRSQKFKIGEISKKKKKKKSEIFLTGNDENHIGND